MPSEITLREVIPSDLSMFFEQQTDPEAVAMVSFTEEGSLDREVIIVRWMEIFGQPRLSPAPSSAMARWQATW